jgi:simple sugar transport system permease protein
VSAVLRRVWRSDASSTLLIAALAIGVGVVVIVLLSDEPASAVDAFLLGPFDGSFQFGTMLARAVPFVFTGAALAMSFRVGVFNLGAEGQLYLGAAAGTAIAVNVQPGGPHVVVLACVVGALAGAGWSAIPGVLRAYAGANEIVITLMLNFVAILFVSWLLTGPLADPGRLGFPQSETIPTDNRLGRLLAPSTLHLGLLVGIALCIVAHVVLTRTSLGTEMRLSGENPEFARYVGLRPERSIVVGMVMSGAAAGLGGTVHIIGDQLRLLDGFSASYGFVGILIALLVRNNLLLVPFAAVFYAWILSGAAVMEETTDVPREVVSVVQGVLFLLVTASALASWKRRRSVRNADAGGSSPDAGPTDQPARREVVG